MSFIRKKVRKDATYYYVVQNVRVGDRVRQRVLCYLGRHKTVASAQRYWKKQADKATDSAAKKQAREMIEKLEQYL